VASNGHKLLFFFFFVILNSTVAGSAIANEGTSIPLRPEITTPEKPLTLTAAVRLAESAFPKVQQEQAEVRAAQRRVTLQKIREYNPESLISYQDVAATHNRLTQTLFSSPAIPSIGGPGPDVVHMNAKAFSAAGFIVDWAPIDFGLHKARIDLSKTELSLTRARYDLTLLDVGVQAAAKYLDALIMHEQVAVAEANVTRFAEFSKIAHAEVEAGLKPAADSSLADAQLANARNDLIRAHLNDELARASLAYAVGHGGELLEINPGGIITVTEPSDTQVTPPILENHPMALVGKAAVSIQIAERHVLDRQYYPKFRWLGGMNLRGTTFNTNLGDVQAPDVSGIFPVIPNWNVGLMVDLPFFDIIRIRAQKKVVQEQFVAARHAYDLTIQELRTDDVQAQARMRAAMALAANMPVQVQAAALAARQAEARYQAGLATVAQVAESNQILADSRVKQAVANVGVWKALLQVAAVHGDLRPFLTAADRATKGEGL
jgi:outer membrane protein TolC